MCRTLKYACIADINKNYRLSHAIMYASKAQQVSLVDEVDVKQILVIFSAKSLQQYNYIN